MRGRYSDPVENLRTYVMVHGGIDRHERLLDIIWFQEVLKAAQAVAASDSEETIKELRRVLK